MNIVGKILFARLPMIVLASALSLMTLAQDSITLDFCYQQLQKTYPLNRQANLFEKSSDLRTKNLNKNYLNSGPA